MDWIGDSELLASVGVVAVASDTLTKQVLADVQNKFTAEKNFDVKGVVNVAIEQPMSIVHLPNAESIELDLDVLKTEVIQKWEVPGPSSNNICGSILHSLLMKKEEHSVLTKDEKPVDHGKNEQIEMNSNTSEGFQDILNREETESERRIRRGEMTPFGNVLELDQTHDIDGSLCVRSYLETQIAFQKKFQRTQRKKIETEKRVIRKKRNRSTSNEKSESDDEPSSKIDEKAKNKESSLKKDTLEMNLLFPKQRSKRLKMGTRTSKNKADAGKSSGLVPSEEASMYFSDDSEYLPEIDSNSNDSVTVLDGIPKKIKKRCSAARKSKWQQSRRQKTLHSSCSEESSYYETEDEDKPKRHRKESDSKDDGILKDYQSRVQNWKDSETRFTKEVHSLEGGFKLPKFIWDLLFNYQKVGVKWLWELHQQRSGGILSDEMGLGKTIQVICFLAGVSCANILFRFSEFRGVGPSLIVCPATVMRQWVQEFHKWWPPFRVALLHESGSYKGTRASFIQSMHASRGFIITTYSSVLKHQDELLKYTWHYVILDEGHKIRNPDAQITISVKRLRTPHRLILSGSPLQNNLKELWSLFDFITPGRLGILPTFIENFSVPITQGGYSNASEVQVATAYKCATSLRDIIGPYLLRRMKSDVTSHIKLPPKNEQVLFCKLSEVQRSIYKEYLKSDQIRRVIQGHHNVFAGLINLRKICNHPHLFDGGSSLTNPESRPIGLGTRIPKIRTRTTSGDNETLDEIPVDDEEEDNIVVEPGDTFGHWHFSGKMIVVKTLLTYWQRQGQKVLFFTQGRQMLCILEKFLKEEKYIYLRLDGGTPIGSRQTIIDKFNTDPTVFVFLLTTRVGGLGVNLTGANRVVIFDPDWNPSTDLQARERAWRIGQDREVTIYRFITSGTIEEKIYHRQIFKQFLSNRILKDPRQKRFFKSNDLLELFTLNEGTEKGTETEAIFEGTDSSVPRPRKRTREKVQPEMDEEPRENSRGKFRGVPNLVKQRPYDPNKGNITTGSENTGEDTTTTTTTTIEKGKTERSLTQDEYVLRKLFKRSGVEAALKHDKIMDTSDPDYVIVEKEAERVAKDAVRMLKKSRDECWSADSGRLTWTGSNGSIRNRKKSKESKSVSSTVTSSTESENATPRDDLVSFFSQPDKEKKGNDEESSTDLLSIIRSRQRPLVETPAASGSEVSQEITTSIGPVESSKVDLLNDIRSFVAFRAMVDGQASTKELVEEFGNKLPSQDSPLFKQMLKELCTSRQVEGIQIWRLKPEFR